MLYQPDKITVVFASPDHAADFVGLQKTIAEESDFMFLTQEETSRIDISDQRRKLESFTSSDSLRKVLLAFHDNRLIGYMGYGYSGLEKTRHTVSGIAIGVLKDFWGFGAARKLFSYAEERWRYDRKAVVRLSVMEPNERAVRLYSQLGFSVEGKENKAICMNGHYVDQLLMWKPLEG